MNSRIGWRVKPYALRLRKQSALIIAVMAAYVESEIPRQRSEGSGEGASRPQHRRIVAEIAAAGGLARGERVTRDPIQVAHRVG